MAAIVTKTVISRRKKNDKFLEKSEEKLPPLYTQAMLVADISIVSRLCRVQGSQAPRSIIPNPVIAASSPIW